MEQTKFLYFLCRRKTQEDHQNTGPPMPRFGGISFIKLTQKVIRSYQEAKTQIIHKSKRGRDWKKRNKLLFWGVNKLNWHNWSTYHNILHRHKAPTSISPYFGDKTVIMAPLSNRKQILKFGLSRMPSSFREIVECTLVNYLNWSAL